MYKVLFRQLRPCCRGVGNPWAALRHTPRERFGLPNDFGDVVLSDFGAAVRGDVERNHDAQPDVYRSPEVMLMMEWSYPLDI